MEVIAAVVACGLGVPEQARRWRRQRVRRPVEEPALGHPPDDIAARQTAGHPPGATAGEENRAPRLMELLGQLAAGLTAADHDHGSRGQDARVGVLLGQELHDTAGYGIGAGGAVSTLE